MLASGPTAVVWSTRRLHVKGMFWSNASIKFHYSYRSYRCCLTLAFNRAFGCSLSQATDVKMNDPVENAKRLAAFKAVDNHVVVMNRIVSKSFEREPCYAFLACLRNGLTYISTLHLGWCHWHWEWINSGLCCWTSSTKSQGRGAGSHLCPIIFPSKAVDHTTWFKVGRFGDEP